MISLALTNKIKGVFYGQAIGDALGLGSEFLSKEMVVTTYPQGLSRYSQIIQDNHRKRWVAGAWTDDTDQFLALCDSITQCKGVDPLNFAQHLYTWYKGVPMGIGSSTQKVLSMPGFTKNPIKAADLVWKMSSMKNASNGAIMRTSILGTLPYSNTETIINNAEIIAKVTHTDPRCIGSCVIVCYLIGKLLQENEIIHIDKLKELGNKYSLSIGEYIDKAYYGTLEDLNLDDSQSMGYTLKTMACALWAYYHGKDFESLLLQIINQGGDADTNACVSGAILGAKFGFDTIPNALVEGLVNKQVLDKKLNNYLKAIY